MHKKMVPFAAVSLCLFLGFPAPAADLGSRAPQKPLPSGEYHGGGRVGGDTFGDATVIQLLPYADTGNTCGFANDYDEVCDYSSSTSPDVVYRFDPQSDVTATIDLCASAYDTKVYVYAGSQGNLVACNDDASCGYSGYQSRIWNIGFAAGVTYYIVIDGYGTACGEYSLTVAEIEPCDLVCPPGAQIEGEPPCMDGYYDSYNGGCGAVGWTTLSPQEGNCGTLCGQSCTFLYGGNEYRDGDWFDVQADGSTVTATCRAEFPVQLILIYGISCANLQYVLDTAPYCEEAQVSWGNFTAGQEFWMWVGPSVFSGVPESTYILEVCGIQAHQPPDDTGACCIPETGTCTLTTWAECNGFWNGFTSVCTPNPCLRQGACCYADWCQMSSTMTCIGQGGVFLGYGTHCTPNRCDSQTSACCLPAGQCAQVTWTDCYTQDGRWIGASDCDPDPCAGQMGACCQGQTCSILTVEECAQAGGTWIGGGDLYPCEPNPCAPVPTVPTSWGRIKYNYR